MEIELETVCGFSPFCRIFKKYLHVPEGEGGGGQMNKLLSTKMVTIRYSAI